MFGGFYFGQGYFGGGPQWVTGGGTTYDVDVSDTVVAADTVSASATIAVQVSETATFVGQYFVNTIYTAFGMYYATYLADPTAITQFVDTKISGRSLGDLTDDGTVNATDANYYYAYAQNGTGPASVLTWITGTMNPYMAANPGMYGAYLGQYPDEASARVTFRNTAVDTAAVTDVNGASSAFAVAASETATGVDAASAPGSTYNPALIETGTGTDAVDAPGSTYNPTLVETGTGTDAVDAPGSTYNPTLVETSTAVDTTAVTLTLPSDVAELATITDSLVGGFLYLSDIAESATGTEAVAALVVFAAVLSEAATGTETVSASAVFVSSLVESAKGTVTDGAAAVFAATAAESATGTDTMVCRFLWEPVVDTQTPNWQNVTTVQSPGWSTIVDTQSPSWTIIPTLK